MTDDRQGRAQEAEYAFPYHYIPRVGGGKFFAVRHWDWGFRYLGGMKLVLDQLAQADFDSLLDVGCGDGRFLREVAERFPGRRLLGVDASPRAVRLAQALNPDLDYCALDIVRDGLPERFAVVTLIEVIEHIPPEALGAFLRAAAARVADGGRLVLTVPHRNKPLIDKHYQHFTGAQLHALLAPHFAHVRLIPFDVAARRAPGMWLVERVLGAKGRWLLLTQPHLLHVLYRIYLSRYLYSADEARCERIAAVCTDKR